MDLKTKTYKGARWTTLASLSNAVVQFLRIAILARLLDKSDFGLMAIVSMIMGFMGLFSDMGISSAILHRQKISTYEYSSLYWFNFFVNTLLFVFICLVSILVASFYNESRLTVLIPLMGVNLFFTSFGRQYAVVAQKELYFRFISTAEILTSIASIVPAVVLAIYGFGVYSLIYSALFASACSNVCFFVRFRKTHGISARCKLPEVKPFLKIGLYQTGGQILNYFNTQFDVILIGKLLGTDALGIYNLVKNLAMRPAQIINPIITKLSAPVLSKMQSDPEMLKNNYLKIIKILSCINFPVHFLIAILSLPIISVVYDMNDPVMAMMLSVMSFYYMLRSVGNPVGGLVVAKGRTDIEFYWNAGMVIVFPFFVYLGCIHSLSGAVIAQLSIMVLSYVPGWFFMIRKLIGVSLKNYTLQMSPFLLYSILASLFTFLFQKSYSSSSIVILFIGSIFFVMCYVLCIRFFNKETYGFVRGNIKVFGGIGNSKPL
jgi:PST family polysaccharide transporter/teichuronic acid exporter